MKRTGLMIDPLFEKHLTPEGHPECPQRMSVLLKLMSEYEREGIINIAPRPALSEEIEWNHDPSYVRQVADTAGQGFFEFDLETRTSDHSYDAACLAAGGLISICDAVIKQEIDNGFAFVRPPGHHAEHAQAMGFCLFNNVAIAAHYLRKVHQLERVLILDWDVHHGNGTEHSFYSDPHVMYMSLHQWPHYPGTGASEDVGQGDGEGFNVNVPLPARCGDEEYLAMFDRILMPIVRQFDPQFVLISAGFDAHINDPLGGMVVSDAGFAAMAQRLMALSEDCCQGRSALVLEGGYDLAALRSSSKAVLDTLGHEASDIEYTLTTSSIHAFHRINDIQARYWKL